jgi:hypothetical protein
MHDLAAWLSATPPPVPYPPWSPALAEDLMSGAVLAAKRAGRRLTDGWNSVPVAWDGRHYIVIIDGAPADATVVRVYVSLRLRVLRRASWWIVFLGYRARAQRTCTHIADLAEDAGWRMTIGRIGEA